MEKDGPTPPAHPQYWTQRQGHQLAQASTWYPERVSPLNCAPHTKWGGGGGGAENEEPLLSPILLGKSSGGQRLPSSPPEPPCGFGVRVEATHAAQNGGTCSARGGGGDAWGMSPKKHLRSSRRLPRAALGPRGLRGPRVRKGRRLHPPSPCTQAETPLEASRLLHTAPADRARACPVLVRTN